MDKSVIPVQIAQSYLLRILTTEDDGLFVNLRFTKSIPVKTDPDDDYQNWPSSRIKYLYSMREEMFSDHRNLCTIRKMNENKTLVLARSPPIGDRIDDRIRRHNLSVIFPLALQLDGGDRQARFLSCSNARRANTGCEYR